MRQPRQAAVVAGRVDHAEAVALGQRVDGIGKRRACFDLATRGRVETEMLRTFQIASDALAHARLLST
jgi:hypothetical protein